MITGLSKHSRVSVVKVRVLQFCAFGLILQVLPVKAIHTDRKHASHTLSIGSF